MYLHQPDRRMTYNLGLMSTDCTSFCICKTNASQLPLAGHVTEILFKFKIPLKEENK